MEQPAVLPPAREGIPLKRSKHREIVEIAWAYGAILLVEWTPRPLQRVLWCAAAICIAAIVAYGFEGWKALGLRWTNLLRSLWVAGAALAVAVAILTIGGHLHALLIPHSISLFVKRYGFYALWACVQQFLLQGFFLLRLMRVAASPRRAALAAAVLFALAHLPNPLLAPLTLLWGLASCLLFLRYRNLLPLAAAHAILGIALAIAVPGPADHNMRVGLGYLNFRL